MTWHKKKESPETWVSGNKTVTRLSTMKWQWSNGNSTGTAGSRQTAMVDCQTTNRITVYRSLEDFRKAQRESKKPLE